MTQKKHMASFPPAAETRLTCQQVTELIIDYVTEDLDTTTRTMLERHLHNCRDCEVFLKTYKATIRVTRQVSYEAVPADLLDRVQQVLRAKLKNA